MDKVSTFLDEEALEGVLLAQKTYQLKSEARMNELGSELEEGEEDEVQDELSQEGESDRETRLRILEVESASQKAESCGKGVEEDMRQHPY